MRSSDRTIAIVVLASIVTVVSLYVYVGPNARKHDFAVFMYEGDQWLAGRPLYTTPIVSTNSPAVTVGVFAPLAILPYSVALWAWLALSFAGLAGSWRAIARELGLSLDRTVTLAALGLLMQGSVTALSNGQLAYPLLLYPVTRAWIAYRHGDSFRAGCWLAPAIAIKPPLALAALLLPWQTWTVAGFLSLGLSLLAVPLTGLASWRTWVEAGDTITWLYRPVNASLWGMAARWTGSNRMADMSPLATAIVLVAGMAFAAHVLRQRNRDRRMLGALVWSVLLSPLGWAHYLVLAFGPMTALWPGGWLARSGYLLLLLPFGGMITLPPALGSLFFIAVMLLWASVVRGGIESRECTSSQPIQSRLPSLAQRSWRW